MFVVCRLSTTRAKLVQLFQGSSFQKEGNAAKQPYCCIPSSERYQTEVKLTDPSHPIPSNVCTRWLNLNPFLHSLSLSYVYCGIYSTVLKKKSINPLYFTLVLLVLQSSKSNFFVLKRLFEANNNPFAISHKHLPPYQIHTGSTNTHTLTIYGTTTVSRCPSCTYLRLMLRELAEPFASIHPVGARETSYGKTDCIA